MSAFPKTEKPWRSASYREWIRRKPCVICSTIAAYMVAHHHRTPGDGISQKPHDSRCLPLCHEHHGYVHSSRFLGLEEHMIEPLELCRKFKEEWDEKK